MKEMEDKRVEDFLQQFKTEIPDQGFTRRVMRHLPERHRLANFFTALTWAACAAAFFLMDGLRAVEHVVMKGLMTLGYECVSSFNWTGVGVAFAVMVGVIGYYGFYAED
jgi:hypothetical protein